MAMVKRISPDGWDLGGPPVGLIKASSSGLRGDDLRALVKRAGHYLADVVRGLTFAPGEVPVHQIALGSTEYFSVNRNGDGFRDEALRKFHPTFEKYARAFRDHQNKIPHLSYGLVKKSIYNPEMHRVELVVALNGTREAADRNGGLVADRELHQLEKDGTYPVSMSCRVAFDQCSSCGNRARNRSEYCDEFTCPAGGLKENMGRLLKSGHVLHADNPEPIFFDISSVGRPADRTAYVTGLVEKVASAPAVEQRAPAWVDSDDPGSCLALERLCRLEPGLKCAGLAGAFAPAVRPEWADFPEGVRLPEALAGLAAAGVVLPPRQFLALASGRQKAAQLAPALQECLPGVYGRLLVAGEAGRWCGAFAGMRPAPEAPAWAEKLAADWGLRPSALSRRLALAALRWADAPALAGTSLGKSASAEAPGALEDVARLYAGYTARALALALAPAWPGRSDLTLESVLTQNRVL